DLRAGRRLALDASGRLRARLPRGRGNVHVPRQPVADPAPAGRRRRDLPDPEHLPGPAVGKRPRGRAADLPRIPGRRADPLRSGAGDAAAPSGLLRSTGPRGGERRVTVLKGRPLALYVFCCAVWGSTWLVIKVGLRDLPPLLYAGLRMALAC